jgi:hypothetical protein
VSYHVDCPHCQCRWADDVPRLTVNRLAPFFPLVELVESLRGEYGRMGAGRHNALRDMGAVRSERAVTDPVKVD